MNGIADIAGDLRNAVRGELIERAPMSRYTTIRVGGPADVLFTPEDAEDLCAALDLAEGGEWPCMVIGAGSNLIVRDGGIAGLVILIRGNMSEVDIDGEIMKVGAGSIMNRLAQAAAREGLAGLEWAVSLPGTLGGGIAGNAGAFGADMSAIVAEARIRLQGGAVEIWDKERLGFSYRSSEVPAGAVVLDAVLIMKKGDIEEIEKRMKEFMEKRKTTQPLSQPSAGSVFRNPEGDSAGRIVDELGLKGANRGGAMISDVHANFIVNTGDATAADIIGLIDEIRGLARKSRGIDLVPEVRVIGREVGA